METNIQNKLKWLFEKISENNYVVNNYYADSVITKLSSKSDPEIQWLEKSPLLSDLVIEALDKTELAHTTVKVFVIRVLATVSSNELHFGKIFNVRGDSIANAFKKIDTSDMSASLKVAYMEVALSITTHTSGILWLLKTDIWRNILNLSSNKQTVFVVRQTYKFASDFLWQLDTLGDETKIINVVNIILYPIKNNNYIDKVSMSSEEEEMHIKILEPMLQIILALFKNNKKFRQKTLLLSIIINNYSIIPSLVATNILMHTVSFNTLIAKVVFWLQTSKIFLTKPLTMDVVYETRDLIEVSAIYYNILQQFIRRMLPVAVLDFCIDCSVIWCEIWPEKGPMFKKTHEKTVEFQLQLVVIPLVPVVYYVFMFHNDKDSNVLKDDESLKDYINKLLNHCCEHTVRASYAMRDLIKIYPNPQSIVLQSVKRLSCLKNYINNDQANLIFQALFHVLKRFDPVTNESGVPEPLESYEETQEKVVIMSYVMETVLLLIRDFNINWHDSIEVLSLYSIVADILKMPNLSCRFIVTSLKVTAMTVMKFQPPNLSLLLESAPGTEIDELGRLIYMKLHERHWEIRDSALELLLICIEISFIKFPPFQKQILENNLIDVTAIIALNDPEVYVSASALKCIGASTKIACIWDQLLCRHPDIQDKLLSVLRNNEEGIVRKEAASVLCDMHTNLKLTQEFKTLLNRHMVSAALTDFHWEVQLTALKYWKEVIHTSLSEQGMLDGTFPSVIFAKESRKIITLNEREIQKRLMKCLEELSAIGCLTVLAVLLEKDVETEIMNATCTISLELLDILNMYKVPETLEVTDAEKQMLENIVKGIKVKSENGFDDDGTPSSMDSKTESVIEDILNSSDINLLVNIYENQLSLKQDKVENGTVEEVKPKLELTEVVTPNMFVYLLRSKDFKAIIETKRQWERGIRSFSSLLDDVLGIYDYDNEVNTMDCY